MTLAPVELAASQEDIDGVMNAALDYIDGYVTRDPERHARAYHPECVKRRYDRNEKYDIAELVVLTPQMMTDYASVTQITERDREVVIDAISEDIASVRIYSTNWVDFLHIVKARGEWKLFHVTWHDRT
jgi:Putative lumazine-binding